VIGRRHVRSNNSWMHNSHRLVKGPNRCTAMLHPDDAALLGIANGMNVRVQFAGGRHRITCRDHRVRHAGGGVCAAWLWS
jgi:anaerobic selenocysteine-containing dehydrogenase